MNGWSLWSDATNPLISGQTRACNWELIISLILSEWFAWIAKCKQVDSNIQSMNGCCEEDVITDGKDGEHGVRRDEEGWGGRGREGEDSQGCWSGIVRLTRRIGWGDDTHFHGDRHLASDNLLFHYQSNGEFIYAVSWSEAFFSELVGQLLGNFGVGAQSIRPGASWLNAIDGQLARQSSRPGTLDFPCRSLRAMFLLLLLLLHLLRLLFLFLLLCVPTSESVSVRVGVWKCHCVQLSRNDKS